MEKGALLPLRFYPSPDGTFPSAWADYEKTKNYSGNVLLKEHWIFAPAFQLVLPDIGRHWGFLDFTDLITGPPPPPDAEITLVSYDGSNIDRSIINTGAADQWQLYVRAGHHRNFIKNRFPTLTIGTLTAGLFYIDIKDRVDENHWISEVFELCDMGTDAMTEEFTDQGGWASVTSAYTAALEYASTYACKTGAAQAELSTPIDVFLEEEIDIYIWAREYNAPPRPACGAASWNDPVYFEFRTEDGQVISERYSISEVDASLVFSIKAAIGGTIYLYAIILAADTAAVEFQLWVQRRYSADNVQIRWKNSTNLCKIFYDNDYENVMFLDSKQVIDENAIEETVVEDDETNKYRIIGTNKKWNSLSFGCGEAMLNAMSLLRLHDNIKIIKETGEVMDVAELLIEQSVLDYEASKVKLIYREDSCSVESCGFDPCCPTDKTPIMEDVYNGAGSLPVAAAANNGDYAMVRTASEQYTIYLSDGAAWNVNNDFDVADDCVEARTNSYSENRFFYFDSSVSKWRIFVFITAVNDNADGTADIVFYGDYREGATVQLEYNDGLEWNTCSAPYLLTSGALTLVCSCGAGTFDFIVHIYTDDCDYGYSNPITQTIT